MTIPLTRALAYAVGRDAGARSMRAAGRTTWNADDYHAAVCACAELLERLADEEAAA